MGTPLARRVVLFGIDGGGTFFERANTPHMDKIFQNGAISPRTLTELPSVSAECWGSMLHGVDCHRHGLTNWIADHAAYPEDSPYPSVFRAIRESRPGARLASFCDWDCVNKGIIEENLGVYKYNARDCDLIQPAIEYVKHNDFTLLYFQFDSVDHMGHKHGYGSPEHLRMIAQNDGYIGRVVDAIEETWGLADTLILVEADHGGTPGDGVRGGGHGGDTDAEKYVFFGAAGPGINRATLENMRVRDTAPAILHALGIAQPGSWNAKIPDGLFRGLPAMPRPEGLPLPGANRRRETTRENGGFIKAFSDLSPRIYLPFEGDCAPGSAPEGLETHGKLYHVPGVHGSALRFDDGDISLPCPDLAGGFTITCWVKLNCAAPLCALFANRSLDRENDRLTPGFAIGFGGRYLQILLNDDSAEKPAQITLPQPEDLLGGWVFLAFAVEPSLGRARVSVDFRPFFTCALSGAPMLRLQNQPLRIGTDANRACRLPADLDDFCLFPGALNDDALARLKAYYQT